MFCESCGQELLLTAKFCKFCGAAVTPASTEMCISAERSNSSKKSGSMTEKEWDEKQKELLHEIAVINKLEQELEIIKNPIAQMDLADRYLKVCTLLEELGCRDEVPEYEKKAESAYMAYISSPAYKQAQQMALI